MYTFTATEYIRSEENINISKIFEDSSFQIHTHDFIEIVYIASGMGQHFVDDVCYNVERGDLLLINFKQTHSFNCKGSMEYINCLIKPEFFSRELVDSENAFEILVLSSFEDFNGKVDCPTPKVSLRGKTLVEVETIIDHMLIEFNEKKVGYRSVLKGYGNVLLSKIFREMKNSDYVGILNHMNRITPEIIGYIEEKCLEKITLTDLARKCFYNPSYFSRIFKECYGKSLTEFIQEKRIYEAMRLLIETSLSVEEICYQVGYKEKKQFYKLFKQHMGITPNEVRKQSKN